MQCFVRFDKTQTCGRYDTAYVLMVLEEILSLVSASWNMLCSDITLIFCTEVSVSSSLIQER